MLHTLHRLSACFIGVFVAFHLINHLGGIIGVDAHIVMMESFRRVYRQPMIEFVLLSCVLFQIGSGMIFMKARWGQRRTFFEKLQSFSGAYLAFFLLNHVGAVVFARVVLELDTNFYFAAAGIHVPPFHYFFVPYYFLAVLAIFSHLACAAFWLTRNHLAMAARVRISYAIIFVGALLSLLIIMVLAGGIYPVDIPVEYRATFPF